MLPGCVAWAFVYATIGIALSGRCGGALAGSTWGIVALVAIVVGGVAVVWVVRRRRAPTSAD